MRSLPLLAIALAWVILPVRDAPASIDPYSFSSVEDVEGLVEAPATFDQWLGDLLVEARERGFSDDLLSRTLAGVQPLRRVVESDRSQAELITTFEQYYSRRVTPEVIRRGQQHLRDHGPLLARIQDAYGVQPRFIVALWGIESRFGTTHGSTPVFQALATLAWEPRRAAFFRAQLYDALTMVARGYIDVPSMSGSWAGAMGQPQFMPSSYLRYAVDFDGDGRRDIWTSHADALASIANYLKHHGWRGDQTWGRPVRVTPAAAKRIVVDLGARDSGCRAMRGMIGPAPLAHWQRLGVRRADGGDLPVVARDASLVQVDTRHFLLYGNYDALLSYNCAHNYALTVALLADRIGEGAAAPRGALSRPAPPVPAGLRAEDAAARPSSPHSRCAVDVPPAPVRDRPIAPSGGPAPRGRLRPRRYPRRTVGSGSPRDARRWRR
jgi:membrane-bound lytic murein transglycosylase B